MKMHSLDICTLSTVGLHRLSGVEGFAHILTKDVRSPAGWISTLLHFPHLFPRKPNSYLVMGPLGKR